ncbi:hypothetical protein JYU34_008979 [Plutella xylostella]|nr:hypothetical protein JYU34_008979 [Plutella xylostella]
MYHSIVNILQDAANLSCNINRVSNKKYITGWNAHVKEAYAESRLWFLEWVSYNRPRSGPIHLKMKETRSQFKSKLKWLQNNQEQIKMDKIASLHSSKKFGSFWKETKKLNPRSGHPVSVGGVHDPKDIANLFKSHFQVSSPLGPAVHVDDAEVVDGSQQELEVRFQAKEVAKVIGKMVRGKSPGHDHLSIEHLQCAGVHLPRVLAMFYNLCLSHSYLPSEMMKTIVVPILKNKTGDASDLSNYRPISLATVIAKVLDSMLDWRLGEHIKIHDAQFGFRPNLSTETAILCLKHTVQYYADRRTPVYACFLDLSKAFDLVSYKVLWDKLVRETTLPKEVISVLKYWYGNQTNCVRWAGSSLSDAYRLECGVRQGGLTSPKLFSLYVNQLIVELSNAQVGCSIDGVAMNNISYADDMVLLSPTVRALRHLLAICEQYAVTHGLRYNESKSEFMVFRAVNKTYTTVPDIPLNGTPLKQVDKFKYLGHWVTCDLSDKADIERERRALCVRANMLARRFARCTKEVKIMLFKAFCQSMYTCSLWTSYTQGAYNALRVQYNNAFRVLLGLRRFCSASGMFAEAHTDGFHAVLRKRCASLLGRVRASSNSLLGTLVDRWDSPILRHWCSLHVRPWWTEDR